MKVKHKMSIGNMSQLLSHSLDDSGFCECQPIKRLVRSFKALMLRKDKDLLIIEHRGKFISGFYSS